MAACVRAALYNMDDEAPKLVNVTYMPDVDATSVYIQNLTSSEVLSGVRFAADCASVGRSVEKKGSVEQSTEEIVLGGGSKLLLGIGRSATSAEE